MALAGVHHEHAARTQPGAGAGVGAARPGRTEAQARRGGSQAQAPEAARLAAQPGDGAAG